MPKNYLIDTGFWIGLFDGRDQFSDYALIYDEEVSLQNQLIPWPSMYEFLNTAFTKNVNAMTSFRKRISRANIQKVTDEPYRENALNTFTMKINWGLHHSLVDIIIREMLEDSSVHIDALVTFNKKDFADVCAKRRIDIISD